MRFKIPCLVAGAFALGVPLLGQGAHGVRQRGPSSGESPADTLVLAGQVVDATNGGAIPGATIQDTVTEFQSATGVDGRFVIRLPGPRAVVRVWAYGYKPEIRTVHPSDSLTVVELWPRPVGLPGLTARAVDRYGGAAVERALHDREITPVLGVAGEEVAALPVTFEPDLLRSLQALPGVLAVNDLSARLHVRGGGPDQNLFLMDGTRIYAPYHMFGIFGSFNPDAVGRVEFYRGDIPARYGGVLSSVVDLEQRDGSDQPLQVDLGFSLLAARATASGRLPLGQGRWMVAFRESLIHKTSEAVLGVPSPVAFRDVQGRASVAVSPQHRVRVTYYGSADDFRMFLGDVGDLRSDWKNAAGSIRWDVTFAPSVTGMATAWSSAYNMSMAVGGIGNPPTTENDVVSRGLRTEVVIQGAESGVRLGTDLETGHLDVVGADRPGGYVQGVTRQAYTTTAGYAEFEKWVGGIRIGPGIRVLRDARGAVLVEPRLGVRAGVAEDVAVTLAAGRSHQVVSTVRDDRYVLPGAPVFFVHPADAPAARSDGVTVALDGWPSRLTSVHFSGFARQFRGLPWWRPAGDRRLSTIRYVRGAAAGFEVMIRRHHESLHGWLGYGLNWVEQTEPSGREVATPWDRRHAIDAALVWEAAEGWILSGRAVYGSGLPFWPQTGLANARWIDPATGRIATRDEYPLWGARQFRYPDYFRIDLSVRARFDWLGASWEPYLSAANITRRENVLYYSYHPIWNDQVDPPERIGGQLLPRLGPLSGLVPSIGLDVRFD